MDQNINGKVASSKVDEENMNEEHHSQDEEILDLVFKIKLEKAEPQGVKISKKNVCLVTIVQNEDAQKEQNDHAKLMDYYFLTQTKTFGS